MPYNLRDLHVFDVTGDYVFEQNCNVPLRTAPASMPGDPLMIRANVYRPKSEGKFPVICTYGPYGKDIHYRESVKAQQRVIFETDGRISFHASSFSDVNPDHKSAHSAWETPDPGYWTKQGYVVVRADERGSGQSPGRLDSMSCGTTDAFFDLIEWCAEQPWSNGKVGLLGISYYAGSQWRVAARRPKGLAAIVPWEGMSDYYRDRVRHGGILSNHFIKWWWDRQVGSNQYGLPGRRERGWGLGSLEGDFTEEELEASRADQPADTAANRFRDDEYFKTKDFDLSDIQVPVLSVANWGGILLHLRGNVLGYLGVSSQFKYLRFITGRHDVPFFYKEEVAVQKSFLDAFLKGQDDRGWSIPGKLPPVDLCLRAGNPGVNDANAERAAFPRRSETEWPIRRTIYQDWHLTGEMQLQGEPPKTNALMPFAAPDDMIHFTTPAMEQETEITGHPMVRLTVSLSARSPDGAHPSDIDLFITLRHLDANGKEVFYTGAVGDPVPVAKGWLRLSLREESPAPPFLRNMNIPWRNYYSTDVHTVVLDSPCTTDIEIWPTNVILAKGDQLVLEIASGDTQGSGIFKHNHPLDRPNDKFYGWNNIHVGDHENFLRLPVIPAE